MPSQGKPPGNLEENVPLTEDSYILMFKKPERKGVELLRESLSTKHFLMLVLH